MVKRILRMIPWLLLLAGLWQFCKGAYQWGRMREAVHAVPICLPLDLSRPGIYHGEYRKRFAGNHADFLRLVFQTPFQSVEEIHQALKGFSGQLVVKDDSGEEIQREELNARLLPVGKREGQPIVEMRLNTWQSGTYQLQCRVDEPAVAVAGRPHCLVGRYMFCGLEAQLAFFPQALGVGCWLLAGVIYLWVRGSATRSTVCGGSVSANPTQLSGNAPDSSV